MSKKLLAGPYLVWMVGFIIIPLALIVSYGLTDRNGIFTIANVASVAEPEHVKALWLSLLLSLRSEEHTTELQSRRSISLSVLIL